jgi:hypothetical protein
MESHPISSGPLWGQKEESKKNKDRFRYRRIIDPDHANRILVTGTIGSGKSVFIERYGEEYHNQLKGMNRVVFDAFGSSDEENLFWCVSNNDVRLSKKQPLSKKPEDDIYYNISMINPPYAKMEGYEKYGDRIKEYIAGEVLFKDILLDAVKEDRVVVFNLTHFDHDHAVETLADYFRELPEICQSNGLRACVLIREAADLLPSVGTGRASTKSKESTNILWKLIKECRHHSITVVADIHRVMDVYHSIRVLRSIVVVKKTDPDALPPYLERFLKLLSKEYNRARRNKVNVMKTKSKIPWVSALKPNQLYIFYLDEKFKLTTNDMPSFHHKGEEEYLRDILGIKFTIDIKLKEQIVEGVKDRFSYKETRDTIVEVMERMGTSPLDDIMMEAEWPDNDQKGFREFIKELVEMGVVFQSGGRYKNKLYSLAKGSRSDASDNNVIRSHAIDDVDIEILKMRIEDKKITQKTMKERLLEKGLELSTTSVGRRLIKLIEMGHLSPSHKKITPTPM